MHAAQKKGGVEIKIEINKIYDTQQRVIKRLIFLSSLLLLGEKLYCDDDKPPKKKILSEWMCVYGEREREENYERWERKVIKLIKLFTQKNTQICDVIVGVDSEELIKDLRK